MKKKKVNKSMKSPEEISDHTCGRIEGTKEFQNKLKKIEGTSKAFNIAHDYFRSQMPALRKSYTEKN